MCRGMSTSCMGKPLRMLGGGIRPACTHAEGRARKHMKAWRAHMRWQVLGMHGDAKCEMQNAACRPVLPRAEHA